ncbi:MAG: prephenate dehydrogenase [Caldilineaceae bacterium]|nr:prephenate dehydrogenase [Caldilineaceae bacterium]
MSKSLSDCRVTVVGLGLMGASLCMDLVQGHLCREVRGVAHRTETALRAFFADAVDQATTDLHAGVAGADIVVLATPVRTIVNSMDELGRLLWPGTLVIDMGSTKGAICAAMDRLPAGIQPIGGHPMTGKEQAGFTAAEPGLYVGAPWILSPLPRTSESALVLATELAQAVGARTIVLEPQRHDGLVAAISHLPFLLASALVHAVADVGAHDPLVWDLAAGGFRDTSRVAASDTRMFMDILATNREAILAQLDCFDAHLHELRALLADGNEAALSAKLARSQQLRAQWRKR